MTEQQVVPTRLKAEVDALVERLLEASKNNELSLPVSSPENRRHTLLTMISNYCTNILRSNPRKKIRLFMDGCFDIMHSGHFNALRQARRLGDVLVVGVHSDEEILRNKGPTTFTEEERYSLLRKTRFVDEVVEDVPYTPTIELLDKLNCDFLVHGDDMPTDTNGNCIFDDVLAAGRMKIIKRTEGISTTDLVGRLLLCTRGHHVKSPEKPMHVVTGSIERECDAFSSTAPGDLLSGGQTSLQKCSQFLPTLYRLKEFAEWTSRVKPDNNVVYVDGAFDLCHVGHAEMLEQAKRLYGDFLLVGIHTDLDVNTHRGRNYPIMNLYERVLNVLSLSCVDEVIIGAPYSISRDLIVSMNVSAVVTGYPLEGHEDQFRFEVPKEMGIFHELQTSRKLSIGTILQRILENRSKFEARNLVKEKKEHEYVAGRQFIEEL